MSWTDVKNKILSLNPSFYSTLGRKDGNIDLSENSYSMLTKGSMVIGDSIKDPIRLRGYGSTEFDGIDDRIITGYGTRRNRFQNPRVAENIDFLRANPTGAVSTVTREHSTDWGGGSLHYKCAHQSNTNPGGMQVDLWNHPTTRTLPDSALVAEAGVRYGVGLRLNMPDVPQSGTMTLRIEWRDSAGTFISANTIADVALVPGEQWVGGVAVAPANTARMLPALSVFNWVTSDDTMEIFVNELIVIEGVDSISETDYFDGDGYVDEQGWHSDNGGRVGWTGTPHASPSDMGVFANGTTRTFTGWAYLDDATTWHTLFGGDDSDAAPLLNISDSGDANFWPNFEDEVLWEDAWPGTGKWVHWALVFDESEDEAELFINGESQGVKSTNLQYVESPGNFQIAAYTDGTAELWDGKQAHVAVFERALTPEEIAEIYDLAINPPPIPFSERDAEIVLLNPEEYGIVVLNEEITGFETNTDVNN